MNVLLHIRKIVAYLATWNHISQFCKALVIYSRYLTDWKCLRCLLWWPLKVKVFKELNIRVSFHNKDLLYCEYKQQHSFLEQNSGFISQYLPSVLNNNRSKVEIRFTELKESLSWQILWLICLFRKAILRQIVYKQERFQLG